MIEFACIVQEGVISEELRPRLASELARISTSILGGDPNEVDVGFTEIPRGFGFRGGELSDRRPSSGDRFRRGANRRRGWSC